MRLGRLAARAVIGGFFVGHGTQKLFGWFGGGGLDGTAQAMEAMSMPPGRRSAVAAGVTEAGSGALLVAGAATPLAAAGVIGTMITAIRKVHWSHGPWITDQGYEYNLVLIAALLGLVDGGPGALSVDGALGWDDTDWKWAAAALALGVAASAAVVAIADRELAAAGTDYPQEQQPATADAAVGQHT